LLDDFIPRREDMFRERHGFSGHSYGWNGGHGDSQVDQMLSQFYPMIASLNNEARGALIRHALTLSIAQIGHQNLESTAASDFSVPPTATSAGSPLSVLQELPVYRQSQGADGATIDFTRPLRWVTRPSELVGVPTAFALEINDQSLAPKYRPGDLILVNPNRTVSPGCSSIVLKKDQKVLVREYVQTLGDKVILRDVTATSPDSQTAQIEIANTDLQSMYRIIGTIENAA
jgi:SOS-response transcriptional repressor LexA